MRQYRDAIPHSGYYDLLDICKKLANGNYFVWTTNVDGQFPKTGFDVQKTYTMQGNYKYLQCIR